VVDLEMAFDNSNGQGVVGFTTDNTPTTGNPQDVETGFEFSIPLDEIGAVGGTDVKMLVFINGTVHDFASNQFSGDGVLQGNLAGFGFDLEGNPNVDLSMIDGNQFVTISIPSTVTGDFNNDTVWDCDDIDALTAAIAGMSTDLSFDMNGDGAITLADVTDADVGWLAVGGANNPADTGGNPFLNGDANLDGTVDGQDFLTWNDTKFSPTDAWCFADFNADGTSDGADFLIWNTNKFQSSDQFASVPEPGSGLMVLLALSLFGFVPRRC
jgi:hypothetical protein